MRLGKFIGAFLCVTLMSGCAGNEEEESPQDDAASVAVKYQEASNRGDWEAVCALRSESFLGGTRKNCVERLGGGKPDSQDSGSVSVEEVSRVPAAGKHPDGFGVLVSSRLGEGMTQNAFRVVKDKTGMKVDQFADVVDSGPVERILTDRAK